uniref:Ah receptor-interacting n=1 Tax=Triatoma infestans TaxID=30076 RepID=A0A170X9A4_TRIIF
MFEWNQLNQKKLPILLNYAQCKLNLKDYYEVIEHCSTVLQYDPTNVKALFRRGKAHAAIWNYKEAKSDFEQSLKLDPSLSACINKCLKEIDLEMKDGELQMKDNLKGKLF